VSFSSLHSQFAPSSFLLQTIRSVVRRPSLKPCCYSPNLDSYARSVLFPLFYCNFFYSKKVGLCIGSYSILFSRLFDDRVYHILLTIYRYRFCSLRFLHHFAITYTGKPSSFLHYLFSCLQLLFKFSLCYIVL